MTGGQTTCDAGGFRRVTTVLAIEEPRMSSTGECTVILCAIYIKPATASMLRWHPQKADVALGPAWLKFSVLSRGTETN